MSTVATHDLNAHLQTTIDLRDDRHPLSCILDNFRWNQSQIQKVIHAVENFCLLAFDLTFNLHTGRVRITFSVQ